MERKLGTHEARYSELRTEPEIPCAPNDFT
jgi:hypothetical protein